DKGNVQDAIHTIKPGQSIVLHWKTTGFPNPTVVISNTDFASPPGLATEGIIVFSPTKTTTYTLTATNSSGTATIPLTVVLNEGIQSPRKIATIPQIHSFPRISGTNVVWPDLRA